MAQTRSMALAILWMMTGPASSEDGCAATTDSLTCVQDGVRLLQRLPLSFGASEHEAEVRRGSPAPTLAPTPAPPPAQTPLLWDGWQPPLGNKTCSWHDCFGASNTSACATCRFGPMSPPPEAPAGWVPDVAMLRRMALRKTDASGFPWPPPLDDTELCDDFGQEDGAKNLLRTVPVRARPLTAPSGGPRVLCLMLTTASRHGDLVRAVRETWASGCDGFLALSTQSDPRIPSVRIPHRGLENHHDMWQKVRESWRFVGTHYLDGFDFFFQCDDDTYLLPENLRAFLAAAGPPDSEMFLGRRLEGSSGGLFNSGGAGYVLSRGAVRALLGHIDDERCMPDAEHLPGDTTLAKCLGNIGIPPADTRDASKRERFHCFDPGAELSWRPPQDGAYEWYQDFNRNWQLKYGKDCCAPDSVSFHYVSHPTLVRHIHALLYSCGL